MREDESEAMAGRRGWQALAAASMLGGFEARRHSVPTVAFQNNSHTLSACLSGWLCQRARPPPLFASARSLLSTHAYRGVCSCASNVEVIKCRASVAAAAGVVNDGGCGV